MLMRKPPFEDDRMLGQDSFSAPVEGGLASGAECAFCVCLARGSGGMSWILPITETER